VKDYSGVLITSITVALTATSRFVLSVSHPPHCSSILQNGPGTGDRRGCAEGGRGVSFLYTFSVVPKEPQSRHLSAAVILCWFERMQRLNYLGCRITAS
jgi:hypothetical protein